MGAAAITATAETIAAASATDIVAFIDASLPAYLTLDQAARLHR
jgi:O-succinylbenzoate synthase